MTAARIVELLEAAGVRVVRVEGGARRLRDTEVERVQQDSRRVGKGDLFVAWRGSAHDAHDHVGAAAAAGAVAAVVERVVTGTDLPQIEVDNARLAAAVAASALAGSPWRTLRIVGVTGTDGKTSSALLLRGILALEAPAAALGTLGELGPDGAVAPGSEGLTTPGPVQLASRLAGLADSGVRNVVMEASSHALDQHRLDGVRFDVMAFTNLTRDHLDYHGTRERYLAAKARLLDLGREGATAVVNADDPAWHALRPSGPVAAYGIDEGTGAASPVRVNALGAETLVSAERLRLSGDGSRFDLVARAADRANGAADGSRVQVDLPLPGRFNVSNALCAAASALALGCPLATVAKGLSGAAPVPGRLEAVLRRPFGVFIDFAHTPGALDKVLEAMRPLVEGRLIAVFGAGGDRDRAKRPEMGAAVARHADVAVVTSDNPRTEDPRAILEQVASGARAEERVMRSECRVVELVDRRDAIEWSLDAARRGDAVLLAGKGHETYQEIGRERIPFDERAMVRAHLAARTGS